MGRVSKIYELVAHNINEAGASLPSESMILGKMEQVQRDIALRELDIAGTVSVVMVNAQADYPLTGATLSAVFAIGGIVRPVGWAYSPTVITNLPKWTEKLEDQSLVGLKQPRFVFLWGNTLRFHPAPSDTLTVTLYVYRYPTKNLVLITPGASDVVDPETQQIWDEALEYGTTSKVLQALEIKYPEVSSLVERYHTMYLEELATKEAEANSRMLAVANTKESSIEDIGF